MLLLARTVMSLFMLSISAGIVSIGYAQEGHEGGRPIEANEELALKAMQLILYHATFPRVDAASGELAPLPKTFADFLEGVDFGMGKIQVKPDGTIELAGYEYRYTLEATHILLSARPVVPGVTGRRYFAFGKRPEGILNLDGVPIESITVEDTNKNGKVDGGEPRLKP